MINGIGKLLVINEANINYEGVCILQAVLSSIGELASVLWTTVIAYTLK